MRLRGRPTPRHETGEAEERDSYFVYFADEMDRVHKPLSGAPRGRERRIAAIRASVCRTGFSANRFSPIDR
jgi:hypothetical protein